MWPRIRSIGGALFFILLVLIAQFRQEVIFNDNAPLGILRDSMVSLYLAWSFLILSGGTVMLKIKHYVLLGILFATLALFFFIMYLIVGFR